MTVRHAYFAPGETEPTAIFDSLESLMTYAARNKDKAPATMPVTLGPINTPHPDDILDDIVNRIVAANPVWETGWGQYEARMRRDLHLQVSRLAASIQSWANQNHGYVVDIRDVHAIGARTDSIIHTGEIQEEEE